MLELINADYRLALEPERGGSVAALQWRGRDLLRPSRPGNILETASFPLVPFSNRIANGRFHANGHALRLSPNFPDSDHPHPLHGFGWLASWEVASATRAEARIVHRHTAGEWPWSYRSTQLFQLTAEGLTIRIALENLGDTPMPAGLGFHPYFPRDVDTIYRGLHCGEWQTDRDGLPMHLLLRDGAEDWWNAQPVSSRCVDTVYVQRAGNLTLDWPSRGHRLTLVPSAKLSFTVVYSPWDADYFCVEPVTHMTDAINRPSAQTGLVWLKPADSLEVSLLLQATLL